jgi:hypothetical protein
MTTDHHEWVACQAGVSEVAGRRLLVLPFAAPVGRSRGRRYEVRLGDGPVRARVVLNVGGRAALVPPPEVDLSATDIDVQVRALRPQRRRSVPADLRQALSEHGLSLAAVPEAEQVQLLLMIGESATPEVRAARLRAAVQAASAWSGRAGDD